MENELFLDTAYAIALSSPRDAFHAKAVEIAREIRATNTRLVTTRAVLLEIGNALAGLRYRAATVALLDSLERDPRVGIAPMTDELFESAMDLYRSRQDKEWGLIDCVSFIVMQERGIGAALTTDLHFRQAGFRVLLRE